jgi:NADPH:quinone reductase-like Zn-dependent oxidoreductase
MRAYLIDSGTVSGVRLTDVPEPKLKPDEALIAVEAFSLNHGELPKLGFFPEGTTGGWDSAGRVIHFSYLAKLVAAGALEAPIVWRGDWGQLPEAIELLASRRISGKAVLRVG